MEDASHEGCFLWRAFHASHEGLHEWPPCGFSVVPSEACDCLCERLMCIAFNVLLAWTESLCNKVLTGLITC